MCYMKRPKLRNNQIRESLIVNGKLYALLTIALL